MILWKVRVRVLCDGVEGESDGAVCIYVVIIPLRIASPSM